MTPANHEEADLMAMDTFFALRTYEDLLHKLEREYERWKADPLNSDCAWNFFVTAEHLPDWLARAGPRMPKGFSYHKFKKNNPLLRVCSHIANGGKHSRAQESVHKSVDRAVIELRGWVKDGWVAKEPMLVVYATSEEQTELRWDTPDRDALWVATKVLEFWRHFPVLQSSMEPSTP
jgi:hypothetical protein